MFASVALCNGLAGANEVTVQNDSLTNNSQGAIIPGFAPGEAAATWLTSPCDGNMVAVDVLWRSVSGGAPQSVEQEIAIFDAGTFPGVGNLLQHIIGPVMTDGVINEFRYLDENQTIPLSVPVLQDQTYVVAFFFANQPDSMNGPSVVVDTGCQAGKNTLFGDPGTGSTWYSTCSLGISGDWVIRAVVNCQNVPTDADVSIAMNTVQPLYTPGSTLDYMVTLDNAGPAAADNTTVVDVFPGAYTNVSWTCSASGGAACTSGGSGNGNIAGSVSLPVGGQISYAITGTVALATTGLLANSATAVVGSPASDPDTSNNTATLNTGPISDRIFADGFEISAMPAPIGMP